MSWASGGPGGALSRLPRLVGDLRRNPPRERTALWQLIVLSLLFTLGGELAGVGLFPPAIQALPLLLGGLLLSRAGLRRLSIVVALGLLLQLITMGLEQVRAGALLLVLVTGLVAYEFSRSREETGLSGTSGETFVVELRERLVRQGRLPDLPPGWQGESVLRPAGGGPFAGDFVVSAVDDDAKRLELALVDVSGKGVDAGTRSLLLSGAMGGLLGALDPRHFLPAANRYLDRQQWEDGFATAVHLVLDLVSGCYEVESAGHPPVAHFDAGSGRWSLLTCEGMALGLVPDVAYVPDKGRLDPGDALLLYTDGLVEASGRDLSDGIDRLLGEAERLVPQGFAGGGATLVDRVAEDGSDDRGLVLLWRDR